MVPDSLRHGPAPALARPRDPGARPFFEDAPFLVIWEVTRACALACLHCRADAVPRRSPFELTTGDGFRLIDRVRAFGTPPPLFVLTGGDPMRRPDLVDLVNHAVRSGLSVALTPSGTAAVTRTRLAELRDAGLSRVAISLDGPDATTHDAFRRVRGSYGWTMRIIDETLELGLPLQINTTVGRLTYPQVGAIASQLRELPLALWALFFLLPTGRGAGLEPITADECERLLHDLHELAAQVPFGIKTTEAPHFFRVVAQRRARDGHRAVAAPAASPRAPRSVNDGNGVLFIDHVGQICPSGFLALPRGNVRRDDLVSIYRHDALFRRLRDPDALEGKCGRCDFRSLCGGSRARAYAATGSPFGADPLCAYVPPPR